ncbi:MAG: hypothetical protein ACLRFE_03665, partial [Clostridia bacterium]
MYTSNNLIVYSEKNSTNLQNIYQILTESNIPFKELHNQTSLFSEMKNPENYIILIMDSSEFVHTIENISKVCFNYQERFFAVYNNPNLVDYFFNLFCDINHLAPLKTFVNLNIANNNIQNQY